MNLRSKLAPIMPPAVYMSVYLCTCLPVGLSVRPSVCPSVRPSVMRLSYNEFQIFRTRKYVVLMVDLYCNLYLILRCHCLSYNYLRHHFLWVYIQDDCKFTVWQVSSDGLRDTKPGSTDVGGPLVQTGSTCQCLHNYTIWYQHKYNLYNLQTSRERPTSTVHWLPCNGY